VSTAVVVRAYRFALDPTPAQARDLERHAGAARFAFNWALAAVKANIDQRRAERSYAPRRRPAHTRAWVEPSGPAA
jgi:uncharacterized protein YijF (DUF1287 family)